MLFAKYATHNRNNYCLQLLLLILKLELLLFDTSQVRMSSETILQHRMYLPIPAYNSIGQQQAMLCWFLILSGQLAPNLGKYTDHTTVVGHISGGEEEVQRLMVWMESNQSHAGDKAAAELFIVQ